MSSKNGNGREGNVVGYGAKSQEDVSWTPLKVEFYRAMKKIGAGTSEQVAKASNGKVSAGNARHFGYHGVGSGLIKVEPAASSPHAKEGQRGFIFVLTGRGRNLDPNAELVKEQARKEKAKGKVTKTAPKKAAKRRKVSPALVMANS